MGLRLIGKAFLLAYRSKRRFWIITFIYATLIGFTAYFIHMAWQSDFTGAATISMLIVIFVAIIISVLYANQLVNARRIELATLKCIGWKSSNVMTLIIGEIFAVTVVGFAIIVEFIFHSVAISVYIKTINNTPVPPEDIVPIGLIPFILTFVLILGVQIVGIIVANRKIVNIRPIQALQMKT